MSIVMAYTDGVTTWIASDTLAVSGSTPYETGPKWYEGSDGWWFGHIGSGRCADIIRCSFKRLSSPEKLETEGPDTWERPHPDRIILRMMREFQYCGMQPRFDVGETVPAWCNGGILARAGGFWDVDSELCITPISRHTFHARGSGAETARGAALALNGRDASVSHIMKMCVTIAGQCDIHVRGCWSGIIVPSVRGCWSGIIVPSKKEEEHKHVGTSSD